MKFVILAAVFALAFAAPRQKRMTLGSIAVSSLGGSTGCVVTGDKLYVNGIFSRNLNSQEQSEFNFYLQKLKDYKNSAINLLEQRKAAFEARRNGIDEPTTSTRELPKVPEKPSFCSAEDTTQYIFDGCLVQGNKVYVGREYARDLTSSEIEELKEFDVKQSAYQNAVQAQMQQEVKSIFGGSDLFSSIFGRAQKPQQQEQPTPSSMSNSAVGSTPLPPRPNVPDFCTAIY